MKLDYKVKKPFKGKLVVEYLKPEDRLEKLKDLNFKVDSEGNVDADVSEQSEYAKKLCELARSQIVEMDIEHTPSGKKFSSIDELSFYSEGFQLMQGVAQSILQGPSLGNG